VPWNTNTILDLSPTLLPSTGLSSNTYTSHLTRLTPHPYSIAHRRSWRLRATNVPRKSRIETQVKLGLELIDVSASTNAGLGTNPDAQLSSDSGDPVGEFSFIRVPKTASVKTKSRGVCGMCPSIFSFFSLCFLPCLQEYLLLKGCLFGEFAYASHWNSAQVVSLPHSKFGTGKRYSPKMVEYVPFSIRHTSRSLFIYFCSFSHSVVAAC
jgi:hypothetical protein